MSNLYYTPGTITAHTLARSTDIQTQLTSIESAFDKLPTEVEFKENRVTYAVDTGVADAYLVALPYTITGYTEGLSMDVKFVNANTGASTIDVDGVGVKAILRVSGAAVEAGDIPANAILNLVYNGTAFISASIQSTALAAAASATAAASSASSASTSATNASSSASAASSSAAASAASALLRPTHNAIRNGNFNVWQRGTSFTAVSNGDYTADGWKYTFVGAGVVDIKQETVTLPDGTVDIALSVDVTTPDASIAASDVYHIRQHFEGYNAVQFGLGASDAKQMTLSFWVYATKTGIHCVSFRNSAVDRSYVAEYTVNATNTWEKKTITLTGDLSGTWLTTNGTGLQASFVLAAGTDFHGTADTWEGANDLSTSNQVNSMDSASNFFRLAQVQHEIGASATAFEHEDYATTLAKCQRYFAKSYSLASAPGTVADSGSAIARINALTTATAIFELQRDLPVRMRATPTITWYSTDSGTAARVRNDTDGDDNTVSSNAGQGEMTTGYPNISVAEADGDIMQAHWTAEAEL